MTSGHLWLLFCRNRELLKVPEQKGDVIKNTFHENESESDVQSQLHLGDMRQGWSVEVGSSKNYHERAPGWLSG